MGSDKMFSSGHQVTDADPLQVVDAGAAASNAAIGMAADAVVDAGAVGTLSAKLRRLTQGLEDLKTQIVIAAGSAILGKVGIDQTTPGTTNKVVADVPTATPTIYNVTLTNANTEYSQALPANCRGFEWQCRTAQDVRYAYVTGKVGGPTAPYATLKAGYVGGKEQINQGASPSTLYFACSVAGVVVCIEAWV